MEKKTTQRIIGMLVVIALVIIMLPLLLGRNELAVQAATTIKVPPVADQQPVVASADSASQEIVIGGDGQPVVSASPVTDKPVADDAVKSTAEIEPSANATTAVQSDAIPAVPPVTTLNPNNQPAADSAVLSGQPVEDQKSAIVKMTDATAAATIDNQSAKEVAAKPAKKQIAHKESSSLTKLKSSAWVVQMGSFNDKSNARRLTDKLRSAGYKAFTREITSAKSGHVSTRVYVGPEFKRLAALQTSNKVAHDLSMHGIVVSFKTLEL